MSNDIPQLRRFSYDDAWRLGTALVEQCRANDLAVTIGIWFGDQRVFHSARPGTSADNDAWLERKARIVRRFRASSLEVARRYLEDASESSFQNFLAIFGLPAADYAPAGGAVPVFVDGHLVAAVGVSGLTSEQDHELAVGALRAAAAQPGLVDDAAASVSPAAGSTMEDR
jgi:uncharacterized protein (UPF0303 family)